MSRLFVLRHGETDWNAQGRLQGSSEVPLNDHGRSQAGRASASLAAVLAPGPVIVASPLGRALETAQIVADVMETPVHTDVRLIERAYGVWEGLTAQEREDRDPEEVVRWKSRREPRIEGYESHESVVTRMRDALDEWWPQAEGTDLVMVTHGSSGRMLILSLLGLPTHTHAVGNLENAAWSRLGPVTDAPWSLERHNVNAQG